MTSEQTAVPLARDQYAKPLVVALLSGCAVALVLGLYAGLHHPTKYALDVAGWLGLVGSHDGLSALAPLLLPEVTLIAPGVDGP